MRSSTSLRPFKPSKRFARVIHKPAACPSVTTSLGQGPNGPFIPEVVSTFPDVPVIDRPGIVSAWDDPKFVAAVEKTGRKNLIIAGVIVDVCLAFAAMQAVDAGYNVYGVVGASGELEVTIRENAVARMKDHGHTYQLDYGCSRTAAGLEARDREGLGAGLPRPLSELRPFDGQLRVRYHQYGQEGVVADSRCSRQSTAPHLTLVAVGRSLFADVRPERSCCLESKRECRL